MVYDIYLNLCKMLVIVLSKQQCTIETYPDSLWGNQNFREISLNLGLYFLDADHRIFLKIALVYMYSL